MALPSENRLKSKDAISLVCKKGASLKTPFFRCVFLPSQKKVFQSVVIVSKKYDNRATERNNIRRTINGFLQQKFSEYKRLEKKFPENMCVIFPYESAKDASIQALQKAIDMFIGSSQNWDFSRKKRKRS